MSFALRYVLPPLFVLTLSLGIAEMFTHEFTPPLRVQMVSLDPEVAKREQLSMEEKDGVLVWIPENGRDNVECGEGDPDAVHVVVLGDSIAFGSGVEADETFSALLQEQLSTDSRRVCVHNHGIPGTGFIQQAAIALEAIERYSPDAVLWTLWSSTLKRYWVFDGVAYDLSSFVTDEDGVPETGLFDPLNRLLFQHSAFYRYAVITLKSSRFMEQAWQEFAAGDFGPRLDRIRAAAPETPMLFINSTPLDTAFRTQAHRRKKNEGRWAEFNRPEIQAELKSRGIPLLQLDEALGDAPVEEVRVDKCCHFNARGMALISDILRPRVEAMLAGSESP